MKFIAAAVLLVVLFVSSQRRSSAQTATCMEPDAVTSLLLRQFRGMMTASDSSLRSALHLPIVDSTEITVVQSDSVCLKARLAVEIHIRTTNPAAIPLGERSVYVIAIRDHFAVALPGNVSGEMHMVDVFSPSWTWLATTGY
jgi:hypothetical protein